jgi:hypothetical protein
MKPSEHVLTHAPRQLQFRPSRHFLRATMRSLSVQAEIPEQKSNRHLLDLLVARCGRRKKPPLNFPGKGGMEVVLSPVHAASRRGVYRREETRMASDQVKRKLAAILADDIAGYSRLMGADEAGTLARLKEYRRELIDPKNKQYRGRVVKTTGDGILIEFPSVVDAVSYSIEVQRGCANAMSMSLRRSALSSA